MNRKSVIDNWKREIEGVYLYRRLSDMSRKPGTRLALRMMADQEERHAAIWEGHLRKTEPAIKKPRPDLRIKLIVFVAKLFGAESVLGLLVNDEVGDISTYSEQAAQSGYDAIYERVLSDEAAHARELASLMGRKQSAEPWHRGVGASGWLRNVVYGFNDGLTANFGLVMGVVGASVADSVILLAGFAGLIADALSMAASGFLASRSEQEVREHHLALERAELHLMPEEEKEELSSFYQRKGLTKEEAAAVAERLMQKPDVALTQLAREELGIDPEAPASPLREGMTTGLATGFGAVIPIVPFLFFHGVAAIWIGIVISMVAHFAVGASRAVFTGRPALRSGFEMFVVGMGVALVTYALGVLFGVKL